MKNLSEMKRLGEFYGVSNFTKGRKFEVDKGFEKELRKEPGEVYGAHFAYEFWSAIWFDGKNFVEQVWRYCVPVAEFKARTLMKLVTKVNNRYGWN